jgi:hypothetical protein
MNTRQALTFPLWWPLVMVGSLVMVIGAFVNYVGRCAADGVLPRWQDIREGMH